MLRDRSTIAAVFAVLLIGCGLSVSAHPALAGGVIPAQTASYIVGAGLLLGAAGSIFGVIDRRRAGKSKS